MKLAKINNSCMKHKSVQHMKSLIDYLNTFVTGLKLDMIRDNNHTRITQSFIYSSVHCSWDLRIECVWTCVDGNNFAPLCTLRAKNLDTNEKFLFYEYRDERDVSRSLYESLLNKMGTFFYDLGELS